MQLHVCRITKYHFIPEEGLSVWNLSIGDCDVNKRLSITACSRSSEDVLL